jgi:hypothetical protein
VSSKIRIIARRRLFRMGTLHTRSGRHSWR